MCRASVLHARCSMRMFFQEVRRRDVGEFPLLSSSQPATALAKEDFLIAFFSRLMHSMAKFKDQFASEGFPSK